MADKDNEFLDEHGDAFSPDEEDEFAIPENAFDDDEELSEYADEFGDNFADEIAIQEDTDGVVSDEDLAIETEEPILQDDQVVEDTDEYSAHHTEETPDDYAEEAPVKQGVGWKAWTGVIILGLVTAGGLAYFVMPDSSPNRSASSQSQQLPTPPQQTQESLPQPPQQQAQQRPAVDVQAFPQQNQQPSQNPSQGGSNGASLSGAQVPGIESAPGSNQLSRGRTGTNYSRDETQAQQGSPMPVDQGAGQNFDAGGTNVIRGNATSGQPMGDQPGYISEIENQLAQFSSIARIAQQNAELITDNREDLTEFKTLTNEEIKEIKARLDALESDETRTTRTTERKEAPVEKTDSKPAKSESGEDGFTYNIPDTPEEIRALQTMLTEKGYRPGPIDGLMGGRTRQAIKRMQQEHGLPITGWLSAETMMVVEAGPKAYSGKRLSAEHRKMQTDSNQESSQKTVRQTTRQSSGPQWYVRGMTPTKAVVYRTDGMSYAVSVGSEIPGMGQVLEINPSENEIRTARGLINRRR